jgi:hypothetical protein
VFAAVFDYQVFPAAPNLLVWGEFAAVSTVGCYPKLLLLQIRLSTYALETSLRTNWHRPVDATRARLSKML